MYFARGDDFMWIVYHIPCFYINRGSACACFNKDFKAELLKGLEKEEVIYIKLETVKVKRGDDFVDEELLCFYIADVNAYDRLQNFIDIFDGVVAKYKSDLCQEMYFMEYDGCMLYCYGGIPAHRDKRRINTMLSKLAEIWRLQPDLRLGQLLVNCAGKEDIFSIEDDELLEAMERFGDNL